MLSDEEILDKWKHSVKYIESDDKLTKLHCQHNPKHDKAMFCIHVDAGDVADAAAIILYKMAEKETEARCLEIAKHQMDLLVNDKGKY